MTTSNWLELQLDAAKHEVEAWNESKREAMRREATSIASKRIVTTSGFSDTAKAKADLDG